LTDTGGSPVSENHDNKFTGVFFPAHLWLTKELLPLEKMMLLEIDRLDNNDGCYATNKHFTSLFNKSQVTISKTITQLKEKGLVDLVVFDGRMRKLKTTQSGRLWVDDKAAYKSTVRQNKPDPSLLKKDYVSGKKQPDTTNSQRPPKHWAVEYWNQLSNPPKLPKHHNPETKSYLQAANYLSGIHHGTLLNYRPRWTTNLVGFFKARSIPVALLQEPWPRDQILRGLRRLAKIYHLDTPRMSLAQMIYNPYTRYDYYSYFFDSFFNHRLLKWRIENRETEPMEKFVVYLKKTKKQLEEEGWSAQEIEEMLEQQKLLGLKGLS